MVLPRARRQQLSSHSPSPPWPGLFICGGQGGPQGCAGLSWLQSLAQPGVGSAPRGSLHQGWTLAGAQPAPGIHPWGWGEPEPEGWGVRGPPPKQVRNPAGMVMGCLCAPVSNKLLPRDVASPQDSPTPIGCFLHLFAPFCTQGMLRGEGPQPKGEFGDVFHLLLQVVSSPIFQPAASSRAEGACLQGQTAKTQHRLLKDLCFSVCFFKGPEKSPSVLTPFLPPPPPRCARSRAGCGGKALPFEAA